MAVKLEAIPLYGGLDEASGKTTSRPGRLLSCENFETALGVPGYRRIAGYERFSGKAKPSSAVVHLLTFDTGTAAIVVGDTVTGPSGSGYVLRVDVATGSWAGGDAAGTLVLTNVTGNWANNDAIQVSAATKALATNILSQPSTSDANYADDLADARDYYRNLIAQPVGYGPILGVAIFDDLIYALRDDDSSGVTATLWKSSASGWTAVRTGLRGGGSMRSVNASFSGAAGDLSVFFVDGKNRCFKYDGTTVTFSPAIYGSEGTSSTSITPGTGSKVFTTEASRDWVAGQQLRVYSASNAGKYMIGTVTTYSGTSLDLNVTSAAGTSATDWHICREDGIDRPYIVAAHKSHLFLGYPRGQLQHSDLGAPFTFSTSSGAIGLGDELVDLLSLRSDVLAIFQRSTISLLYGSSALDWELKQHSRSPNTRARSAQDIGGNGVYLNDAGVISLVGTDAFGDFDAANIAAAAKRTLTRVMADYKCTSLIKTDSQYRIYGASSEVLVMSWVGVMPNLETASYTTLRYLHQPVCVATDTVDGEEFVVFGTSDGWVMQERIGTTFDGQAIKAGFRTSHWHSKSPDAKKRYRKLTFDCDAVQTATVNFKLDFDFAGYEYASGSNNQADVSILPTGGFFDADYWDTFVWSNPEASQLEMNIDGVGRYMSVLFWSDGDFEGFSVYNMTVEFSPLELKR